AKAEAIAVVGFQHVALPQEEHAVVFSLVLLDLNGSRLRAFGFKLMTQSLNIAHTKVERARLVGVVPFIYDQPDLHVVTLQFSASLILGDEREAEHLGVEPDRSVKFLNRHGLGVARADR